VLQVYDEKPVGALRVTELLPHKAVLPTAVITGFAIAGTLVTVTGAELALKQVPSPACKVNVPLSLTGIC
jgi:hypothetical protein